MLRCKVRSQFGRVVRVTFGSAMTRGSPVIVTSTRDPSRVTSTLYVSSTPLASSFVRILKMRSFSTEVASYARRVISTMSL